MRTANRTIFTGRYGQRGLILPSGLDVGGNGEYEYPIVRQADWDMREAMRARVLDQNPTYQGENAWWSFSDAEKAAMTGYTATSPNDIADIIRTAPGGTNRQIKIMANYDGHASLSNNVIYGPHANSLADNPSVDVGKTRPDYSVYIYAAPGRTPGFTGTIYWRGQSKIEIDGVYHTGTSYFDRDGTRPLLPMAVWKNAHHGGGNTNNCFRGAPRLLHLENMDFPAGRVLTDQPQYFRMINSRSWGGNDQVDVLSRRGYDASYMTGWDACAWMVGNHFFGWNRFLPGDTDVHFDFFQDGDTTIQEVIRSYNHLWEYNVFHIETSAIRNNCQGHLSTDNNGKGIEMNFVGHNTVIAGFTGASQKGVSPYDDLDTGFVSLSRIMSVHSSVPYGQGSGMLGTPSGVGSSRDYTTGEVNPAAGPKRVTEMMAGSVTLQAAQVNNRYTDGNVNISISPSFTNRRQRVQNILTGTPSLPNNGFVDYPAGSPRPGGGTWPYNAAGYEDPETYGSGDSVAEKAKFLAFVKPRRGWRQRNAGPINPAFWPTAVEEYKSPLGVPPPPSLARPPIFSVHSAPSPTKEPDIIDDVVARVGDLLEIEPQVYLNGGAQSNFMIKVADTIGGALTDLDTNITRIVEPSLLGKYLYVTGGVENMSGTYAYPGTPYGPIGAPLPVLAASEDWSRVTVDMPASSTGVEIMSKVGPGVDPINAPLYSRTGSMGPSLLTHAASPTGRAMRPKISLTNHTSSISRNDITNQLALPWDTFECRSLIQFLSGTNLRSVNIGDNLTGTGTQYTGLLLAGPTGGSDGTISLQRANSQNSGTAFKTGLGAASGMIWVAFRAAFGVLEGKAWIDGQPEPAYGDAETGIASGVVTMARAAINTTTGASSPFTNPCCVIMKQDFIWTRP
ncbi:MAG: hypothetical protein DI533_04755 [Cereibacter sphaeroides]|uniref:Uncharacterized protein n=1 Tax=Cereibacter sphaeroides TaxID=1063 RepID=A0A2W5U9C3_CERSP|nr:MAG: hypothetical protein DI533_04755 [Cereibacter sphaeroides]